MLMSEGGKSRDISEEVCQEYRHKAVNLESIIEAFERLCPQHIDSAV